MLQSKSQQIGSKSTKDGNTKHEILQERPSQSREGPFSPAAHSVTPVG